MPVIVNVIPPTPKNSTTNSANHKIAAFIMMINRPIVRKINARAVSTVAKKKAKKLPQWLQASLKDVEEGRVYGPYDTVEELRASLESRGP